MLVSVEPDALPDLRWTGTTTLSDAHKGRRKAFDESSAEMVYWDVYDRYAIPFGSTITGPALVEERETTTVVPAGARVIVQDNGTLLITLRT